MGFELKKKTLHASEQEREDVQQARRQWQHDQGAWNRARLVFLDETWASTFIAALHCDAVTAPMVVDGPINGALFLAWVRAFLCPALKPGDVVIADNLSSHKVSGVREAIEAAGATIGYLPPYSPDLNPICRIPDD